eukprot:CAMPEP_0185201052 /NCGR_PEP_ID=MMETSP1140-20130426/48501_1 /TAXON_ID=298111 /ORGANISM="Pavlova sp., Strain CCMP459" /LENGTH=68 /DNA_ID=CAMNT_0027768427 /DNA_START=68 /DNA_END=274 /DNA_ORIENTATION=-
MTRTEDGQSMDAWRSSNKPRSIKPRSMPALSLSLPSRSASVNPTAAPFLQLISHGLWAELGFASASVK